MPYSPELAARTRKIFARRKGCSEKKMFGGLCFLINGNMACGIVEDRLMVRVGPDAYTDALARPHAREMDFTGRPLKGMVFLDPPGIATDDDLKDWVERGVKFARSLPAK